MHEVVICEAVRTPIGRFQGALSDVRADDLAAVSLREVLRRTGIDPALVDEVILGCANQAGEDNRNVARMAAGQALTDAELLAVMLGSGLPGQNVLQLAQSLLDQFDLFFSIIEP